VWPNFTKLNMLVARGHGLVLLWWHFDTLCTSGFTDDVIFSYHRTNRRTDRHSVCVLARQLLLVEHRLLWVSQPAVLPRWPRMSHRTGHGSSVNSWAIPALMWAVSSYDYRSCHYAVAVWWLVFRRYLQDSLVQCLVQFIRIRHHGPGWSLLSMIVMTCCNCN